MKTLLALCFLSFFTAQSIIGQKLDTTINVKSQALHDMYLQKRKTNNTVGWVLLGSGVTLMGIGFGTYFSEQINSTYNNVGEPLFYVGLTTSLISIPFFIAARQNKNNAKLALKNEAIFIGNKMLRKSNYAALSLTIHF